MRVLRGGGEKAVEFLDLSLPFSCRYVLRHRRDYNYLGGKGSVFASHRHRSAAVAFRPLEESEEGEEALGIQRTRGPFFAL